MRRMCAHWAAIGTVIVAGLGAGSVASAQDFVFVSEGGAFDPTGSVWAPFDTFGAGVAEAVSRSGGTGVAVTAGTYPETLTVSEPALIVNPLDGTARVGDFGSESTRFEVATFNTHLYGAALPEGVIDVMVGLGFLSAPVHWLDGQRANQIAGNFSGSSADVVAMQEVWSVGLMGLIPAFAQYPHFVIGSAIDHGALPGCVPIPGLGCQSFELNSGLVTMSRQPIVTSEQVFYGVESGEADFFEPYSSKGWLRTEIAKDGFKVAVYNTHAQAGSEFNPQIEVTRLQQMAQLQLDVTLYRNANPSVPVILTGDFNVRASGDPEGEYTQTLRALFDTETLPFVDAARADRVNRASNTVTADDDNLLHQYFGGGGGDKRLDYVLYAPSQDGSVRLALQEVETVAQRGQTMSDDGLTTSLLSDHRAVHATFTIVRD